MVVMVIAKGNSMNKNTIIMILIITIGNRMESYAKLLLSLNHTQIQTHPHPHPHTHVATIHTSSHHLT